MSGFLEEIANVITDLVRCARDRRLSVRLITRDHIYAVKTGDLWYWTKDWQRAEDEAMADLRAGRYADFGSAEELVSALSEPSEDVIVTALRRITPRSAP